MKNGCENMSPKLYARHNVDIYKAEFKYDKDAECSEDNEVSMGGLR